MRIFKVIKGVAFLGVLVLMNLFLSFLLEPARGASELMWKQYYAEEEIDTLFIGSSLCQTSFDSYIFDEKMGVKSFNMGTPLQAMPQTARALEVAIEDHEIKTVIFGMGFSTLKYEPVEEAELTFEKARAREKGGMAGFIEGIKYIYSKEVRDDEKSINYLFPWLYNREDFSPSTMKRNATQKIQTLKDRLNGVESSAGDSYHKGYVNETYHTVDYEYKWDGCSYRFYDQEFDPEMMAEFEKIIKICKENEIDLIAVNTPHPTFDVISCYEFYDSNENEFKALCEKYDVDYYDFSLAKPEIFETRAENYADHEHMNKQGSEYFSACLSELLLRRADGEEMEQYFYDATEFIKMYPELVKEWDSYYW